MKVVLLILLNIFFLDIAAAEGAVRGNKNNQQDLSEDSAGAPLTLDSAKATSSIEQWFSSILQRRRATQALRKNHHHDSDRRLSFFGGYFKDKFGNLVNGDATEGEVDQNPVPNTASPLANPTTNFPSLSPSTHPSNRLGSTAPSSLKTEDVDRPTVTPSSISTQSYSISSSISPSTDASSDTPPHISSTNPTGVSSTEPSDALLDAPSQTPTVAPTAARTTNQQPTYRVSPSSKPETN